MSVENKMTSLFNSLQLCREEAEIVSFLHCSNQSYELEQLCNRHSFKDFLKLVSFATETPLSSVREYLGREGRLVQSGIIEDVDTVNSPYFELNRSVVDYIAGYTVTPLSEKFIKQETSRTYPLETFSVTDSAINIIKAMLLADCSCNILFYGNEGAGKTELAKALISCCNMQPCFVQHGDSDELSERRLALTIAAGLVPADKGVIVVDEADMLLNSDYMFQTNKNTLDKGWLNYFIDQRKCKIIWITNHICSIDRSVRRRFEFSYHFKNMTPKERNNIWNVHLNGHPYKHFFNEETVNMLSSKYQVNAGAIGNAMKTIKHIIPQVDAAPDNVLSIVGEILERHQMLMDQTKPQSQSVCTEFYDINALNTDTDIPALMQSIISFFDTSHSMSGFNLNVLLWGISGTGKTELAKHIAQETGMELIIRRASALISCYVGETEKNIRDAFDDSQRQHAILFIDEVDSFLTAREMAHHSWEISGVNEFLTQMENHSGILFCCTNFLKTLDSASLRRFNWKIEFRGLREEAKLELYRRYFAFVDKPLSERMVCQIKQIPNLTPGDMKAVWQKTRYTAHDELRHENIIEMLFKEVRYKDKDLSAKIGFNS